MTEVYEIKLLDSLPPPPLVVLEQPHQQHLLNSLLLAEFRMEAMEALTIRKECIANIMNILITSPQSEKKENEQKIQAELMLDLTNSTLSLMDKLQQIRDNIDQEIEIVNKPEKKKKKETYQLREFSVRVQKMSLHTIKARASSMSLKRYIEKEANTNANALDLFPDIKHYANLTITKVTNKKPVSPPSSKPEELLKMKVFYQMLGKMKARQTGIKKRVSFKSSVEYSDGSEGKLKVSSFPFNYNVAC